jgi:membrane-associated phospholipid phosphatase
MGAELRSIGTRARYFAAIRDSWYDMFFLSISECILICPLGSLKNAIGKPRPDLIDRCKPLPGSADPLPFGLSNSSICTQTSDAILKDGFRSFPSGHSSSTYFRDPIRSSHVLTSTLQRPFRVYFTSLST